MAGNQAGAFYYEGTHMNYMGRGFTSKHWSDTDGLPLGGAAFGAGFTISWQRGPVGQGEDRAAPNGAFVEDVLRVCLDRLNHYQKDGRSEEHATASKHVSLALAALDLRKEKRKSSGVHDTTKSG